MNAMKETFRSRNAQQSVMACVTSLTAVLAQETPRSGENLMQRLPHWCYSSVTHGCILLGHETCTSTCNMKEQLCPLYEYEYSFTRWHDNNSFNSYFFSLFPHREKLGWEVHCWLSLTTLCSALACHVCHVWSTTRFLLKTFGHEFESTLCWEIDFELHCAKHQGIREQAEDKVTTANEFLKHN